MQALFEGTTLLEKFFWLCAIAGTLFFVLKIGLMFIVGVEGDMAEADIDADMDVDGDSSDVAFKLLSINSLTGFFMMFGWVGLAGSAQYGLGGALSCLLALAAGLVAMFITGYLFAAATKLASPGSRYKAADLVGRTASVYSRIPAEGKGQIQISSAGQTREIDALSEESTDIASHKEVEVVRVIDENTVAVKEIS